MRKFGRQRRRTRRSQPSLRVLQGLCCCQRWAIWQLAFPRCFYYVFLSLCFSLFWLCFHSKMLAQHFLFICSSVRSKQRSLLIPQKMRSYMHLVCWERFLRCFDKLLFLGWFVFEGEVFWNDQAWIFMVHFLHLNKGSSVDRGWGQSWNMSYCGAGASDWNCKGSVSGHKDLWTDWVANRIVAWTWGSCQLNVLPESNCAVCFWKSIHVRLLTDRVWLQKRGKNVKS